MKNSITKDFIAYDYLKLEVLLDLEQLYVDCYQCLGWKLIKVIETSIGQDYYINSRSLIEKPLVILKFKRNRKIKNKVELLKIQKSMEISFKKVNKLNKEADIISTIYSVSLGVIGLLFIIFSILSFIAKKPFYIFGVVNAVVGVTGFTLAFFMYNKKRKQIQEKNEILIEEQYNNIYEYCEQANNLIR